MSRREVTSWLVSVLVHCLLILEMIHLLWTQPRFTVRAGETSTEMEFISAYPVTPPPAKPMPPLPSVVPIAPQPLTRKLLPLPPIPKVIPLLSAPRSAPHPVAPRRSPKSHPAPKPSPATASNPSKGVTAPEPDDLHNDAPIYPDESRMAHEEGVVILRVEVTASGDPAGVSIKQSSGYFRLDQAARRAVMHWRFHPGLAAGSPVASEAQVPIHFKLEQ